MQQLESNTIDTTEKILRRFELKLLHHIGFVLTLDQVASSYTAVQPELYYYFKPGDGIYETVYSDRIRCYKGSILIAIANEDFSHPDVLPCAKVLLRQAIQHATTHHRMLSHTIFTRRPYDYS